MHHIAAFERFTMDISKRVQIHTHIHILTGSGVKVNGAKMQIKRVINYI